jgi:hypothetical protein
MRVLVIQLAQEGTKVIGKQSNPRGDSVVQLTEGTTDRLEARSA